MRNKIFFETVAAVLLSLMAIVISFVAIVISFVISFAQYKTTAKQTSLIQIQTDLAKIQTDLAKEQTSQQRKEAAITSARDWAKLRELLQPIVERYPLLGPLENPALKNLSREEKLKWLSEMESLVSPLGTNPILIGSRHNYERYLAMLSELRFAKRMLGTDDNDPYAHSFFYQVTVMIAEHATSMWWDLGMERSSGSVRDGIYKPTTPEESIALKGFPWEKEIRGKDTTQTTAPTDPNKPRR